MLKKLINNFLNIYYYDIRLRFLRSYYLILYYRGNIDLRTCKSGDILISAFGNKLKYIRRLDIAYGFEFKKYVPDSYIHEIEYSGIGPGTRSNNGAVFIHNKLLTDKDIIRIMK